MKIITMLENKINIDDENQTRLDQLFKSKGPQIILLVGLPGSGKSTFVNNYRLKKHAFVASTDNIIEEYAKAHGMDYNEAFKKLDFKKDVESKMKIQIRQAANKGENIIIDQTNMTDKSRQSKMSMVPKHYERYAIVLWPPIEVVRERLLKREKETGKSIPETVIQRMLSSYIPPDFREGFKDIIFVK